MIATNALALLLTLAPGPQPGGRFAPPGKPGAEFGPAGNVVLLSEDVDAGPIPELAEARGPVVLLSLYANMDPVLIGLSLGVDGESAQGFYLRPGDRERSDDRELLAALRAAGTIGLWGGELEDWYAALWPNGGRTAAVTGLLEAHRSGATVVARGEAMSLLAAAAVWDGEYERSEPHRRPASPPHDQNDAPVLTWNLGLQPWAAIDTHQRSEGNAWELLDLMVDERLRLGAILDEDAALVFDPSAAELRARGPGAVWLFDLRNARRGKGSLQGLRLSKLLAADSWSMRRRAADSTGQPVDAKREPLELEGGAVLFSVAFGDTFQPGYQSWTWFASAAASPEGLRSLTVPGVRDGDRPAALRVTPDSDARIWVRDERVSISNLRLDLEWEP